MWAFSAVFVVSIVFASNLYCLLFMFPVVGGSSHVGVYLISCVNFSPDQRFDHWRISEYVFRMTQVVLFCFYQ